MTKSLTYGPNPTAVGGLTNVTFSPAPIHFAADMVRIESGAGKVVYTDVTAPVDQPATLRIAQAFRSNVYAGTSIDAASMLPSKRGVDIVVEQKEVWLGSDTSDATYHPLMPVRCAITLNVPLAAQVTPDAVEHLIGRTVAALYAQGDGDITAGLNALLHGVVEKG